ncbi:hypothetical protein LTR64_004423 [Lithohypha guttulata]|uniref:uncharacterized protein n=1 Tax=Lithohypha guttulata TaxID=1690604 RepID=UPI002DE1D176|nr:hypothetical protein LTR51_006281 [Lithohypha guttulata]
MTSFATTIAVQNLWANDNATGHNAGLHLTSDKSHANPQSIIMENINIKMEVDDDDSTDEQNTILRSLKTNSEPRDSPNSSMTSQSGASSVQDIKPSTPKKASQVTKDYESPSKYIHSRVAGTFKAKSSIPSRLPPAEYARQCVAAAEASRLPPYALHEEEQKLLQDKLCQQHVTVYLNIRNGVLRLWTRNPGVSVSIEEAIGCARDERWTRLACFAWEWLVRRGYINFGCVEPPAISKTVKTRGRPSQRETVVVVGGGMAGLCTARQLTNLFQHYPDHPTPRIIVLEGRNRLGGRIYSHPLNSMRSSLLPSDHRSTAEAGAHIIIGFEGGNPLDAIIRGQLGLDYHSLRDLSTLYDVDGTPVNGANDVMMEKLYNDILDRTGTYRLKNSFKKTASGERETMDAGRDPPDTDDTLTLRQYEEATAAGTIDQLITKRSRRRGAGHRAAKQDNPEERIETSMESKTQLPAAQAAKEFGFLLRKSTELHETLEIDSLAEEFNQSLGLVMDESVKQYQKFLDLKPYALRLMNWHFANLEYANAANVDRLSLRGWDQDTGHEFSGPHSQVKGGYQQLPRGLYHFPTQLDVRTNKPVKSIRYGGAGTKSRATIICEDGESFEADKVVFTAPLGVLKENTIQFEPPLPQWKRDAIRRMGFGLLNKLILVFDKPFWDVDRDMFGLLRQHRHGNGFDQTHYKEGRGQFYFFWNTIKTTGLPCLVSLMAGESAFEAERTPDNVLVEECLRSLRACFGEANVPMPLESVVTRWGSDRFARGTYSFVAKEARPADYDMLAEPISNLHFAGEATCRYYPATVHGAYLSGLRVANEILETMTGPIAVPPILVPAKELTRKEPAATSTSNKTNATIDLTPAEDHLIKVPARKGDPVLPAGTFTRPAKEKIDTSLNEAYDAAMWVRIYDELGPPPPKPQKSNVNAYLMFQMEKWDEVKTKFQGATTASGRRAGKDKHERDRVRVEIGRMWNELGEEAQRPYKETVEKNRFENDRAFKEWQQKAQEWDKRTWEVKDTWIKEGNTFEEFCSRAREERDVMDGRSMKRESEDTDGGSGKRVKV